MDFEPPEVDHWTPTKAATFRRAVREHRPELSDEKFALDVLGMAPRTTYDWQKNPNRKLRPSTQKALKEAFSACPVTIKHTFWELIEEASSSTDQRIFQSTKALFPSPHLAPLPDPLETNLEIFNAPPERQIAALRGIRQRYEKRYREVGGLAIQARLREYIDVYAIPLVRQGGPEAQGLARTAGGLLALAGMCAYDAAQPANAKHYYSQALELARASGDAPFTGYVISLLATLDLRTGNPYSALSYTNSGLVTSKLSPAILADINCISTEAIAQLNDKSGTARHAQLAYEASNRIVLADEPPESWLTDPGIIHGRHAEALRSLGDLGGAEEQARLALSQTANITPRDRTNRLIVLTNVLMAGNKMDEALETAEEVVSTASSLESRVVRSRIKTLQQIIRPYSMLNQQARSLDAHIEEFLIAPM